VTGRVAIFVGYPEIAVHYAVTRCNVSIDGKRERCDWGSNEYEVTAGRHTIEVSYSRGFGRNTIDVVVRAGEIAHVYYFARVVPLLRGWMKLDEPFTDAPAR
jgi:hypothetical protein